MENHNTTATLNVTRMIYQYLHHSTSVGGDLAAKHANRQTLANTPPPLSSSPSSKKKNKQPYSNRHPVNSIHYWFIMTLYSTQNGYSNDTMVTLARSYVRDLILNNGDCKFFLGSPLSASKKEVRFLKKTSVSSSQLIPPSFAHHSQDTSICIKTCWGWRLNMIISNAFLNHWHRNTLIEANTPKLFMSTNYQE